ncbi:hypothetical protein [Mycoplasma mycoides]|uniref:hypothetical protein n=1 Tax=Mycoplasma mycoides TaxID=2102 RepID=UPI0009B5995B|nr:hypothetical protein [Mycoplasma mycoides]BCU83936.1 hypothetical protein mmcaprivi_03150 [Mycoplasma mycoides]
MSLLSSDFLGSVFKLVELESIIVVLGSSGLFVIDLAILNFKVTIPTNWKLPMVLTIIFLFSWSIVISRFSFLKDE